MGTYDTVAIADSDLVATPTCPGCGESSDDARLLASGSFTFNRCRRCDLCFMNPQPTASFLARFYSGDYWALTNSRRSFRDRAVRQPRRGVVYTRLLRRSENALTGGKFSRLVLESGLSFGLLLETLEQHLTQTSLIPMRRRFSRGWAFVWIPKKNYRWLTTKTLTTWLF